MPNLPIPVVAAALALGLALAAAPARAEKADRTRPIAVESDQDCIVDLQKETNVCSGNVVITQGTLQIRADRIELRKTADGYQTASAQGSAERPARYRQKRDHVDEYVEGRALRIDYDARANTLRFEGQASARRLRGAVTADEIQGHVIVWDNAAEAFSVQGGTPTATNPSGRVRAVLSPREAASAPAAASAPTPLRSTPALGEAR